MKSLLQKYSLVAALTLALPFALVGCNKSADSDTTAPAFNPPPADTTTTAPAADTNAASTMAALAATDIASKVYWTTVPRSQFEEFGRVMREYGANWDDDDPDAGGPPDDIGLPDDQVTTWVDTRAYGGQKFDALAAHASQTENIFFLRMGPEKMTDLMGLETFVRVQDRSGAQLPEDDLFAGLRDSRG